MFLIQQPTKNGWAQGRRVWRRGTNVGEWQRDAKCTTSACGRWEGATYRIVDNCTLLGHDAERHDPNTAMMASKIAGKLDLI
jgi:hypothetical protein